MIANIRPVEEKDNEALAGMIRKVFEEHDAPQKGTVYSDPTTDNLYLLFRTPRSVLWVAEMNDSAIGCCGVYPTKGLAGNCAELVKFYLSKEAQGKRDWKRIDGKMHSIGERIWIYTLYLESLPHFSRAVLIYEKQGFVRLDHPLGKSEHTACNIWMVKELKQGF